MNSLASAIANSVRQRLHNSMSGGSDEVRLIFHGPPMEILQSVFTILDEAAHEDAAPVLLKVPALGPNDRNPAVGSSGRCDDTHLLSLRNSPQRPSFVALVPPGQHSMLSVTSTTDEFGVAAANNGSNVPFENWWSDDFVAQIARDGISAAGIADQAEATDALALVAAATAAADEIDDDLDQRVRAWRVLSRLFEAANCTDLRPGDRVSLACGFPPTKDGKIASREQIGVLDRVADAMSDGFGAGIRRAKDNAVGDEPSYLDELLDHLRNNADRPTAFERATSACYAPFTGDTVDEVPAWWRALTAERWSELLTEDSAAEGDILVSCPNALARLAKGMPVLVQDAVEFSFEMRGTGSDGTVLQIGRGPKAECIGTVQVDSEATEFVDDELPVHRTPIRYIASAPGYKPGILKVVSLATWEPGIFVVIRLARKMSPPRKPSKRAKGAPELETSLTLPGAGRYDLALYTSPGVELELTATGTADENQATRESSKELEVRQVRDGVHQIEVEIDANYQLDIGFTRVGEDGGNRHACRVFLIAEETAEQGCRSEFERLIRANRRSIEPGDAKAVVQINRSARSASLQEWLLAEESVGLSFLPLVLADDYDKAWVQPTWGSGKGPVLSTGRFLHDPRPDASEFNPPPSFIDARKKIASRIRGAGEQTGLAEAAELGKWLVQDEEFRTEVEQYLDSYAQWLVADPDIACWVDVSIICSLDDDRRTIARAPDAVLVSPLHPVRVAWHALAQRILFEADSTDAPCPAVSVLDPDSIVDLMTLALRSPSGIEHVDFLAVENSTDYWSVLWNGNQLSRLPNRSRIAPFGDDFGITVGGISVGFSAAQVSRAIDDVAGLLPAKPRLGVVVASAGGTSDSCNDGLISWSSVRFRDGKGEWPRNAGALSLVDIFDHRDEGSRPDDATIANLAEDTKSKVRWFGSQPEAARPDLGIIAQLDMSEPAATEVGERSPLGYGALLRHRVRRQLPGAFLSESRQSVPSSPSGDVLADKIAACVSTIESRGDRRTGMRFAPNVNAIQDMLDRRNTDFVAASSSAIDPACFLGGWLERAYLWDYDMPSYSHRSGDTNGYYLLSRVRDSDCEALSGALTLLPGCGSMPRETVQNVLLEIARRGIPTIRGLAGADAGATGDLGMFIAVRLLQDRFRLNEAMESLLPVIETNAEETTAFVLVPIDPFRGYLSDLARSLGNKQRDASLSRPDLLVAGIKIAGDQASIHLTPIEVKCRPDSPFPQSEVGAALEQARTFSRLLSDMLPRDEQATAWSLGFQHLLLSIIGFGMRVYSQHEDVVGQEGHWASIHERVARAILQSKPAVSIDPRGRLIIVDNSARSGVKDHDNDGFNETIVVGAPDGASIVCGDSREFYDSVRAKLDRWELLPTTTGAEPTVVSAPSAMGDINSVPGQEDATTLEATQPDEAVEEEKAEDSVDASQPPAASQESRGVVLEIGTTVDGFRKESVELNISDTRLNQLNMGVVGDLGTGKTQLLKSLILQISAAASQNRGIRPRFLIFDYKRDYSSPEFVEATNARVVKPHRLPLNLFDTATIGDSAAPWLDRFRFFADVLDKIYSGIGPVQRDKLKKAVRAAYDSCLGGQQPTLYDVHREYQALLDGKSDSPMAIIDDLVDMEIFASNAAETLPFDQFLDGVVVISLDSLGQDDRSKNMLVAVMLNMFYENMLRTPKRPFVGTEPQLRAIDSYLLVDEADNIMRYEFDVLRKLLLQGREFGTGVILASQYLRHFKAGATDYREPLLTWFVHKVPNVTPAELGALGLAGGAGELAERIKSLQVHQCLYNSFDVPGEIVRGVPFFELQHRLEADR
jgi:hypothetical protein